MINMKKISVIGLWHQGVVGAACMADLGYDVIAADHDEERIKELTVGNAPLFEPGLDDLIKKGLQKEHLSFTSNIPEAVIGRKEVMIMFDVPVDENDKSNLSELLNTIDEIIPQFLIHTVESIGVLNRGMKFYVRLCVQKQIIILHILYAIRFSLKGRVLKSVYCVISRAASKEGHNEPDNFRHHILDSERFTAST